MQKLINGLAMSYTDEGAGLPLLFIHGFALSSGLTNPAPIPPTESTKLAKA